MTNIRSLLFSNLSAGLLMRCQVFAALLLCHAAQAQTIDMSGSVSYSRFGSSINLSVGRIDNLQSSLNMSGTLALQLWATGAPYSGGLLTGYKVAEARIGQLQGGYFFSGLSRNTDFLAPPDGTYNMVMVVGEWSTFSYEVTDWSNFTGTETFTDFSQRIRSMKLLPPKKLAKSGQVVKLALSIKNATSVGATVPVSFTSTTTGIAVPTMTNLFIPGRKSARFSFTVVVDPSFKGVAVIGASIGFLPAVTATVLTVK